MSIEGRELALRGDRERAVRWFAVLSLLPLAIVLGVLGYVSLRKTGNAAPPPLGIVIAVPLAIAAVQVFFVRSLSRAGVFVGQGELIVRTGVGTQRIALSHLRKHGLRRVDLSAQTQLRPALRTRGAGLPGMQSGWFRLRNGERAVCLVLDRAHVCYLRSDEDNLSVLLSLQRPEELEALLERGRG